MTTHPWTFETMHAGETMFDSVNFIKYRRNLGKLEKNLPAFILPRTIICPDSNFVYERKLSGIVLYDTLHHRIMENPIVLLPQTLARSYSKPNLSIDILNFLALTIDISPICYDIEYLQCSMSIHMQFFFCWAQDPSAKQSR